MNTLGERLRAFREYKDLSQEEFLAITKGGLNQTNMTQWENNRNGIGAKKRKVFKKYFPELNLDWLESGEGEMLTKSTPYIPTQELSSDSDYTLLKLVEELMKEKARLLDLLEKALTTNANFPEDSSLVPTHRLGWTTIQPAA